MKMHIVRQKKQTLKGIIRRNIPKEKSKTVWVWDKVLSDIKNVSVHWVLFWEKEV